MNLIFDIVKRFAGGYLLGFILGWVIIAIVF